MSTINSSLFIVIKENKDKSKNIVLFMKEQVTPWPFLPKLIATLLHKKEKYINIELKREPQSDFPINQ